MRLEAFTMKLKPGTVAEYKKRHDEIWPELARELHQAGISDYSIFLDEETLTLFAVRKLGDHNCGFAPQFDRSEVVGIHVAADGSEFGWFAGREATQGSLSSGLAWTLGRRANDNKKAPSR